MCNTPNEKQPKRTKKALQIVLFAFLGLLVAMAITVAVLYFHGRNTLFDRNDIILQTPESMVDVTDKGDLVTYNGKTYRFNENVVGILVMGVDKDDIQSDATAGSNGQADTLLLAAVDTVSGAVNMIPISRETMVEVDRYTEDGSLVGSEMMQLCLAYAYTPDSAASCENVCRSVSRLLYGAPIDSYIAIDMDGVVEITDALGGVTVTVLEDIVYWRDRVFLDKGDVINLNGRQGLAYIRYRNHSVVNSNNLRMQRQKQFFTNFVQKATNQLRSDFSKLGKYYSVVEPYVISDLTLSQITYLASTCLLNRSQLGIEFLSIKGETVDGGKHAEFYPDSNSVYEAVLTAFYEEVEE